MKKLFFLVAAMAVAMFAGAEEKTLTLDLASGVFDGEGAEATITWSALDGQLTVRQFATDGATSVNNSYISAPRLYKGHGLMFSSTVLITKIELTYTGSYYGSDIVVGTEYGVVDATFSANLDTKSGGTHVFSKAAGSNVYCISNIATAKSTQLRPTKIDITYVKPVVTEPTISVISTLNFGKVFFPNTQKTITVTCENLTVVPVATLNVGGGDFKVEGTLTTAGGELVVTCLATIPNEYDDVITITAAEEAVATVALSAEVVQLDGEGSKENPLSIADVLLINSKVSGKYWVEGYILGALDGSSIVTTADGNIVLGATKDADVYVPVQLPVGEIRTALNVKNNAENVGKKAKVYGSLEAYFSMPGVKSTSDYVLESGAVTALENAEVMSIYAENGRIFGADNARIFTINGQDVTAQNGQLNGIYIVKSADKATKIVVR